MGELEKGDLVLATKWHDGDPCDHFAVGYWIGFTHHSRHRVVDSLGNLFRGNGFRRVEKISQSEGEEVLKLLPIISDKPGNSVWYYLETIRQIISSRENLPDCDSVEIYK